MAHEQDNWFGVDFLYATYMYVWVALLGLTIVEVIVPEPSLIGLGQFPRSVEVLSLILLALVKTFCVAWYYMHLIDERPSIILIACAPFIFSVFLTIGLWPHHPANSRKDEFLKNPPGVQAPEDEEGPQSSRELNPGSDGETVASTTRNAESR